MKQPDNTDKPKSHPVIAFTIAVVGLILFTILLWMGKIGSTAYTVLISITCLAAIAVHCLPRLVELDLKNLRIILSEMRSIKKDVYAKKEEIRQASIYLAELIVFNMSWQGRSHSGRGEFEDFNRERVTELLRSLDVPEDQINKICDIDAFRQRQTSGTDT